MTDDIVERLRTEWDRFSRVPTENKFWLGPSTHARLAALFLEAAEDIERLCKERDDSSVDKRLIDELWQRRTDASETNARMRQLLGDTEQLKLTVARLTEDLRRGDAVTNLITANIVSRKLRVQNHNA
jgi:hypothetical protein